MTAAYEKLTKQINDLREERSAYTAKVRKPRKILFWTYVPEINKWDHTYMLSCFKEHDMLDRRIRINNLMKMCENAERINLDAKDFKLIQR